MSGIYPDLVALSSIKNCYTLFKHVFLCVLNIVIFKSEVYSRDLKLRTGEHIVAEQIGDFERCLLNSTSIVMFKKKKLQHALVLTLNHVEVLPNLA